MPYITVVKNSHLISMVYTRYKTEKSFEDLIHSLRKLCNTHTDNTHFYFTMRQYFPEIARYYKLKNILT